MKTVNVHDAKTNFSQYLSSVERGEVIVIARRNLPIAEIHPYQQKKYKRRLGTCKGEIVIPPSFFKPLPKSLLKAFNDPL